MIRTNESVSLVPDFLVEDKPPLYMVAYSAPPPRLPLSVIRWGVKALCFVGGKTLSKAVKFTSPFIHTFRSIFCCCTSNLEKKKVITKARV